MRPDAMYPMTHTMITTEYMIPTIRRLRAAYVAKRGGRIPLLRSQGQLAVIFPEYDIAMGTMAAEDDCNVPLKAFVNTVLYKCSERPLPENQRGYKALCRRLKAFTMAPAASDRSSMAEEIREGNIFSRKTEKARKG